MNSSRDEQPAPAMRLAELMPRLCRAIMRREFSCVDEARTTAQQMWALEIIHEQKECPQRLLLSALQLKASTGTIFVDRLCKMGLAKRAENPNNRRAILLTLTRKGENLLARTMERRGAEAKKLFAALPAARRREYVAVLESLLGALKV
ncbi:MAG: MarR family transcriptional regulator [Kiritimatiellae bacterium]|nr:MarR family transcriptional regulator [Kiritimatiellia bacterium]